MKVVLCVVGVAILVVVSTGVASADCQDKYFSCTKLVDGKLPNLATTTPVGRIGVGQCWKDWGCKLCDENKAHLAQKCNSQYSACQNNCAACEIAPYGGSALPCYTTNGVQLTL